MNFDNVVDQILAKYYTVNEQYDDRPHWLYQPLQRIAREREDYNFNSYWGDWNKNVAPKLADTLERETQAPTSASAPAAAAPVSTMPSPLDNYSREQINQITSQPKRDIHPMDAEAMKKENSARTSQLLSDISKKYPDFPPTDLERIRQEMDKAVDDYTQDMLQKTDLHAKASMLNIYRQELKDIMDANTRNIYQNAALHMQKIRQGSDPQQNYTAGYMSPHTPSSSPQVVGYATKSGAPDAIAQHAKTGKWPQQPVMSAKKY